MNTKQMIKENNRLQDAMKPNNLSYYQDMVVYIRSSSVQEQKARLLLEIAQHLLDAQSKAKRRGRIRKRSRILLQRAGRTAAKMKGLSSLNIIS